MSSADGNAGQPVLPTLVAALAVLMSASAFAGVLADYRWVLPTTLVVGVVAGVGIAGRSLRWWPPMVVIAQLTGVWVLLTALFSDRALLGLIPTPESAGELSDVLTTALETVRNGIPPVPADRAVRCLICLGLGVVAVLVDTIAVTAAAPAVSGLVLLSVFAIPASLAKSMLPWSAFLAGAVGFALLLMTGGTQHYGSSPRARARTAFGGHAVGVISGAAVLSLLTGSAFTGVGTEGRLPGDDPSPTATGQIGLRPFTSLRGQLDRDHVVELFRVKGLPRETYLRAMTLRKFDPNSGWRLEGLTQGVETGGALPLPEGTEVDAGTPATVRIEPVGYRDPWLPVFGMPRAVTGMGPNWRYDPASGIVFTQTRQESRAYVERLVLPEPTAQQLRASGTGTASVHPAYLDSAGVAPRIANLARKITANAKTDYDRAVALNRYFTNPANGFTYDLRTAPPQGNEALIDFLFHGKRGFCEQYASSMAVLLRTIGIPSRVAVGFTAGYQDGDERVITTDDAHAWVEAYFPGWGWTTFDPTPLDDGRTTTPDHMAQAPPPPQQPRPGQTVPAPEPTTEPQPAPEQPEQAYTPPAPSGSGGVAWGWLVLAVLVLAAVGATPAAVREAWRRRRLQLVAQGNRGAAATAWHEVLDEFRDRGTEPNETDTLRNTASTAATKHGLDSDGARALNDLVAAVEREWYASPESPRGSVEEPLRGVREGLSRSAPLNWRQRLLPRSMLRFVIRTDSLQKK